MSRAGCLTRSSTCIIDIYLRVFPVVWIPLLRSPFVIIRKLREGVLYSRTICLAELLSELCRTYRADLHALSAGYAFVPVYVCSVSRTAHIRRVIKLRGTDSVADARSAVTDTNDLVLAVDVRYLMDKAVTFCTPEDLHSFFLRDVAAGMPLDAELSQVTDTYAELALDLSVAFSTHSLLLTAGALSDTDLSVVLIEPVGDALEAYGFRI